MSSALDQVAQPCAERSIDRSLDQAMMCGFGKEGEVADTCSVSKVEFIEEGDIHRRVIDQTSSDR